MPGNDGLAPSFRASDMIRYGRLPGWLGVILLVACEKPAVAQSLGASARVQYNRDIRPLLSDKCFRCHGPDGGQRKANLRLDQREVAVADRQGYAAIVPGKPDESEVYLRITAEDDDQRMPPRRSGKVLKPHEVELLRRWIEQGADYQPHWAFIPPQPQPLPKVQQREWIRNPIDTFILSELEGQRLKPSPEA